jgi:hypothetical protein
MSHEAIMNQQVGPEVRAAGRVPDRPLLVAWVKALPPGAYPRLAALLKKGVSEEPADLEAELIEAFLAHPPAGEWRWPVEALLLGVLGRDPDAATLGFADYLPLTTASNGHAPAPVTILDRAVQVGERTWQEWPETRRRREYLLLDVFDAALTEAGTQGRDERLAASLRQLAGFRKHV